MIKHFKFEGEIPILLKGQLTPGENILLPDSKKELLVKNSFQHALESRVTLLNLDFNQVHWLHQPGLSSEHASVQDTPGRRNDLTASTVNGISVEGHIIDVEPNVAHVLVTQAALHSTRVTRILNKPGFQQGRLAPSAWARRWAWRRRALSWQWGWSDHLRGGSRQRAGSRRRCWTWRLSSFRHTTHPGWTIKINKCTTNMLSRPPGLEKVGATIFKSKRIKIWLNN